MRVLVACEFSGVVRRAFAAIGHDAWSCDLLPAEDRSNKHIVGDAREILHDGWDLLIVAHPPCTRLCNSGVRWLSVPPAGKTLAQMWSDLREGAAREIFKCNCPHEVRSGCTEPKCPHYVGAERAAELEWNKPYPHSDNGAPTELISLLNVMQSAYSKGNGRLMSVWERDIKAVEDAIAFYALPRSPAMKGEREELLSELRSHEKDYPSLIHGPLCGQAADEIESLRAQIASATAFIRQVAECEQSDNVNIRRAKELLAALHPNPSES